MKVDRYRLPPRHPLSKYLQSILLCVAGVAFPVSRIPRIQPLAHAVDLLLLIAAWAVGLRYLTGRAHPEPAAR